MNTVVNAISATVGRAGTIILVFASVSVTWGHSAQATTATAHDRRQVFGLVNKKMSFPHHKESLQRVLQTEAWHAWRLACVAGGQRDHKSARQRLVAATKIFNAFKLLEGVSQGIVQRALETPGSASSGRVDWQRIVDRRVARCSQDNVHQVRLSVSRDADGPVGQMLPDSEESNRLREILQVSADFHRRSVGTLLEAELVAPHAMIESFDALTLLRNGDTVFTNGQLGWKLFGRAVVSARGPKAEPRALDLNTSIPGMFDLTP